MILFLIRSIQKLIVGPQNHAVFEPCSQLKNKALDTAEIPFHLSSDPLPLGGDICQLFSAGSMARNPLFIVVKGEILT